MLKNGNIYHQHTPNVCIYTSTMDPMGHFHSFSRLKSVKPWPQIHGNPTTLSRSLAWKHVPRSELRQSTFYLPSIHCLGNNSDLGQFEPPARKKGYFGILTCYNLPRYAIYLYAFPAVFVDHFGPKSHVCFRAIPSYASCTHGESDKWPRNSAYSENTTIWLWLTVCHGIDGP